MRASQLLWIAGLGALFAFAATRLELTHSITHFMPSGEQAELVSLSTQIASSELTRTAVLSISLEGAPTGHEDELIQVSSRFTREVETSAGSCLTVCSIRSKRISDSVTNAMSFM